MNHSIHEIKIYKFKDGIETTTEDLIAVEEPLEIKLIHGITNERQLMNVSITMRTPGNDYELAIGFLFTEGIITSIDQLKSDQLASQHLDFQNTINIECNEDVIIDKSLLQRNFYTTSACGVCGKSSIDAIYTIAPGLSSKEKFIVSKDIIIQLPELLSSQQNIFKHTGGIHAAALFNKEGQLLEMREDVGRHNALDKLIGNYFLKSSNKKIIPVNSILLLSGRASFELLQKSAMAGISIICAVGAPSSLAVETAIKFDITLIGFLKNNRFNVYSNPHRIQW
ncbi:MAG: formate dehydrogenase accessory sulfurtransferase FdhD [Bacteroidota bacterium]